MTSSLLELLAADREHYKSGNNERIGLAAKWCPSLDLPFDCATLICESIASMIFPCSSSCVCNSLCSVLCLPCKDPSTQRSLAPLRKALDLPEVHMALSRWESIDYSRVASLAMRPYEDTLLEHDGARARKFLDNVCIDEAKIPVGALLPHELKNEQWAAPVANLASQQKFKSCIAMCNIHTLSGKAATVSAALSLLISELSESPWKG